MYWVFKINHFHKNLCFSIYFQDNDEYWVKDSCWFVSWERHWSTQARTLNTGKQQPPLSAFTLLLGSLVFWQTNRKNGEASLMRFSLLTWNPPPVALPTSMSLCTAFINTNAWCSVTVKGGCLLHSAAMSQGCWSCGANVMRHRKRTWTFRVNMQNRKGRMESWQTVSLIISCLPASGGTAFVRILNQLCNALSSLCRCTHHLVPSHLVPFSLFSA